MAKKTQEQVDLILLLRNAIAGVIEGEDPALAMAPVHFELTRRKKNKKK